MTDIGEKRLREIAARSCPNCFGAGCFVCLPEFSTDEPGEHDPQIDEEGE